MRKQEKTHAMVRSLRLFAFVFALIAASAALAADPAGIILLHGKESSPSSRVLQPLVSALVREGFLVSTPEMPWSGRRIYDQSYDAAMEEIDNAVKEIKERGAKKIFIAGHSLGANAALHYATRASVDGVLALAPGHVPESATYTRTSLAQATRMVQAGKGDERASFDDGNQGRRFTVKTTPKIYLSYMDPLGPAVMPKSAAAIKPGTPLLWVVGTYDPMYQQGPLYAFQQAPPHPQSKYVVIKSDHSNTPRDATDEILAWLRTLQNP
jgi:pimeloyl-ACP methyl ester carboxylesterase